MIKDSLSIKKNSSVECRGSRAGEMNRRSQQAAGNGQQAAGSRQQAIGSRQEAKGRWMDGPAVTKRADVPVPNEINRDPPVSRTPLRLSEIQRLPDGQSSRRSQPAWATTDRDRSHGASVWTTASHVQCVRVQEYCVYHEYESSSHPSIHRVMR